MTCRFCETTLEHVFVDLGRSPLANSYLEASQLHEMEPFYPLRVLVCHACLLVQLPALVSPRELFGEYAYFSSYSSSWVEHARRYADAMIERFDLDDGSQVVEIASNDGYLLQHFAAKGVPVLGVEPAANVAREARGKGIPTVERFFGAETARELSGDGVRPDLVVANNVLAHVPDLNGFVTGLTILLAPGGVATLEFPSLVRLIEENQFDTIYHEHLSYFSFHVVQEIFRRRGLTIFDVDELRTHGGSLRIYARRAAEAEAPDARVADLLAREAAAGFQKLETHLSFAPRVEATKRKLLRFLIDARDRGERIVGYGAAAKGNTLLNYCGIRTDLVDYVVDRSPHKQGRWLPGTLIPVFPPERIRETRPDYLLLLAWNLKQEIVRDMAFVRDWGGRFVVPIPDLEVLR